MSLRFDKLDHDGIVAILNSPDTRAAVHDLAEQIASGITVEARDGVVVDDYTTDRAASSVTIRDPRGLIWVARDGALLDAAAEVGLEVTDRT